MSDRMSALAAGRARPIPLVSATLFAVALTALLFIALFPIFPNRLNIHVGDNAAHTVKAPRTFTFESAFLTNQQRDAKANTVQASLVYDPNVRTSKLADYDELTQQIAQIRSL